MRCLGQNKQDRSYCVTNVGMPVLAYLWHDMCPVWARKKGVRLITLGEDMCLMLKYLGHTLWEGELGYLGEVML